MGSAAVVASHERVALLEAEISRAEALEYGAIGARNVGIEYIGGCHQPGIVLAETARRTPLNQRAPSCVRLMQPLNGKAAEIRRCGRLVGSPFQDLFDGDDGHHQSPAAKRGEQPPRDTADTVAAGRLTR